MDDAGGVQPVDLLPESGDGVFVDRARCVGAGRSRRDGVADRAHDDQGVATSRTPGGDDDGDVGAGPLGEQGDQRFVLDELDPTVADRPLDPPVPQAPPHVGQQPGVPGIAAVHLDVQRPVVVVALEQHHSFPLYRRRRQIVDDEPEVAEGEPDPRHGRAAPGDPKARWTIAAASIPKAIAADPPDGNAAPSRIAPTNCIGISQLARLRNGRVRCGDAVDITAVATTTSAGGNTGGPSTSNSRSATPVPSSMTIAAAAAAPATPRPDASTRSRARARRPRATAATRSTSDHATGVQNINRHNVSKNPGTSATTPETDCSNSASNRDARPAMTTTSALTMATTASVGRRDLGSSCAEANNWSPSARLGGGRTAPAVPSLR